MDIMYADKVRVVNPLDEERKEHLSKVGTVKFAGTDEKPKQELIEKYARLRMDWVFVSFDKNKPSVAFLAEELELV